MFGNLVAGVRAEAAAAVERGRQHHRPSQSKFSHVFAVEQLHVHRHRLNEIDQSVGGNKCYAAQSKYSHVVAVEQLHVHCHRLNEIDQSVRDINVTRRRANSATGRAPPLQKAKNP
jgi:hypothetical protein